MHLKNKNSKEVFGFGKVYDKQYREKYRKAYEKNNILNLDYIINNEVEENIDHLVEINISLIGTNYFNGFS